MSGLIAPLMPDATPSVAPAGVPALPAFRRALRLAPASFSLLFCGLDASTPDASYEQALWWTGLVRSDMEPLLRSDLHLFLIGPAGSLDDGAWRARRSRLETDERFCRKFVWLPSPEPGNGEIDDFLDRTFLARPWTAERAEPRSLDVLGRVLEEAQGGSVLDDAEAEDWLEELGSPDAVAGHDLARRLVSLLKRTP